MNNTLSPADITRLTDRYIEVGSRMVPTPLQVVFSLSEPQNNTNNSDNREKKNVVQVPLVWKDFDLAAVCYFLFFFYFSLFYLFLFVNSLIELLYCI